MSDVKYFNFPIQLLSDLFKDKNKTLDCISEYALYAHSLKLELGQSSYDNFLSAAKFFHVVLGGGDDNKKRQFKSGKDVYNSIPKSAPKVGLNITIFWDFYKNEKSEFDLACLAAFLAIRSILGDKPYCKITNAFFWARMCGYPKKINDVSELSASVAKYANEYQTRKIKNALSDKWFLVTHSRYTRGFYVSFKLDIDALVYEAEKQRKSTKDKQRKEKEKAALEKARLRLGIALN
jgi:hypothetical protein